MGLIELGFLSISDMAKIVRKHFLQILALSIAVALVGVLVASMVQTYTCTLGFKYNHEGAATGLAPDGVSKLDPYEIQNPVVIQAALKDMGLNSNADAVKGIRQNIAINKVVTDLDQEVSESAAMLGEKYDVAATEYEMKLTYKASLGDEFGARIFSNIVNEYDEYLLSKYYNKKNVEDFAKVIEDVDAEYIVVADKLSNSLDSIIENLDTLAGTYPDFRSGKTGYTFSELSDMYEDLRDIQYAKYYGNIRAGNLAKDREMVIKSYRARVNELWQDWSVDYPVSENYREEITTFYDSYKAAGLYRQAEQVQRNVDSSNNRDQDVIEDKDLEDYTNTYDDIILSYTDYASNASNAVREIDNYNMIIDSYVNDTVPQDVKNTLIKKNESILKEIVDLSKEYSKIANTSIDEFYDSLVNTDLQYLILPEVKADIPVSIVAIFLFVLAMGIAIVAVVIAEITRRLAAKRAALNGEEEESGDSEELDETHHLLYDQFRKGFSEFFLVYQKMVPCKPGDEPHSEAFIRWQSPTLGLVSPGKIFECVGDFGIYRQLNDWIIKSVCEDLAALRKQHKPMPVVHINCPYSQVNDFALNDIILKHITDNDIPAKNICLELTGKDIAESLDDIMLLDEMGIGICIDRFENSNEEQEIINVVKPGYIKMSLDILNSDMYATSDEDVVEATMNMLGYFSDIIDKCHKNGIKTCICGIEKRSQDNIVAKTGFDYKQGYYYGKPEKI